MFLTSLFSKTCFIFLLFVALTFGCTDKSWSQEKREQSVIRLESISDDTRIWTGNASLRWYNFYILSHGNVEEESNTELDLEFRHLWLTTQNFGWGLQGMMQIYMTGFFGNVGLGNVGVGPLLRVYPWQNNRWQFYLEGSSMAGYNLALSDALGANRSEGMRYRVGLHGGLSYRVSDKFGIYFELGPDWEANGSFEFDSRALQLDIGIQLFRF